jgi:hypothetical protein
MPDDISTLNRLFLQCTHHQHAAPIYWRSSEHGPMLFCWGENGNLRAWTISANGVATYLACSAEVASAQSPVPPGGMPGGMMCLSANGSTPNTAVLWGCIPYFDANTVVSPGRLLAYDATAFGSFGDGSGQLRILWDRQDWNLGFSFCKFTRRSSPTASFMCRPTMRVSTFTGWPRLAGSGDERIAQRTSL